MLNPITMDNTSLFEAIQWCDEEIKDLSGEMKPRHTFNMVVQDQQNLDDFITLVAGSAVRDGRQLYFY